ncbi:hypothetical protein [Xanthobacter agilis]|uniref:Uncharacterized protein n=1 Tax=Xanthobacter agilis TaxID=47492 RepID=A0ABU0LJ74_XANAG|nr:hypothetical protein [Xanthobacter agilis]MDQ0507149.1 hypothetical protein [Xanthobacter agilis]
MRHGIILFSMRLTGGDASPWLRIATLRGSRVRRARIVLLSANGIGTHAIMAE